MFVASTLLALSATALSVSGTCPTTISDGRGCPGAGSFTPTLSLSGDLALPTDLSLELDQALGGAGVIMIVGSDTTSVSYPGGCTLTVSPDTLLPTIIASGSGPGAGSVSVPVPNSLALTAGTLYVQAAVLDSTAPAGFVLSNRIQIDFDASCAASSVLANAFLGSHGPAADVAYLELLNRGTEGIDALIATTYVANPGQAYAGQGFRDARSSRIVLNPVSVRTMALYAVDGILADTPAPYHAPVLNDLYYGSRNVEEDALDIYQAWWATQSGQSLAQLQAGDRPLSLTGIDWTGSAFTSYVPIEVGTGTEVPDSATPIKVNPGGGVTPEGDYGNGAYDLPAKDPSGPEPYNCLSWALGCQDDRWTQPGNGVSMDDIMSGAGYSPAESADTTGASVKLVYHSEKGTCADGEWVHAMKEDADGNGSSKNGSGSRYGGIGDCEAFLMEHYPAPEGKQTVVKTYTMSSN